MNHETRLKQITADFERGSIYTHRRLITKDNYNGTYSIVMCMKYNLDQCGKVDKYEDITEDEFHKLDTLITHRLFL